MGTTQLVFSLGEGNMSRLGKWRRIENYPPEKTNDAFIRDMVMKMLNAAVPDEPVNLEQIKEPVKKGGKK
jgi:hypothetical protein